MASLTFMPHIDKENVGSINTNNGKGMTRAPLGLGGKVFQSNHGKPLATPRRALGDLKNQIGNINSKTPGNALKKPSIKIQADPQPKKGLQNRPGKNTFAVKQGPVQSKPQVKIAEEKKTVPKQPVLGPIEIMDLPSIDSDDDYEDILPKKERISTYIEKLINWRPPCLFGQLPGSDDSEDEEEARNKRMLDIDLPPPPPVTESSDLPIEMFPWSEPITDIDLQSFDDIQLPEDIPLPSLDESIDILQNIGQLQMKDSFTT